MGPAVALPDMIHFLLGPSRITQVSSVTGSRMVPACVTGYFAAALQRGIMAECWDDG